MHSIIHFIYNYVGKQSVGFHSNQNFSDIFFDKFKNLLDDYIVNYQIKYFFYILFISFFYLELSEGMFQLLHNYSSYNLSIFGSFLIDLCGSLFNIGIFDFMYSYFAFNLNSFGFIMSLFSSDNLYFSIFVMGVMVSLVAEKYELYRDNINLKLFVFFYFIYSFFFFILTYFDFISLSFYIVLTLSFLFIYTIYTIFTTFNLSLEDPNMVGVLIILLSILMPYYITFFLFIIIAYFYLTRNIPFFDNKPFSFKNFNSSFFGDLLIVSVLSFFVLNLSFVYYNISLFILSSFPFMLFIVYMYRDDLKGSDLK